jgi:hypothetical protein
VCPHLQRLTALNAGTASAAVDFATLVAGPGLGEIDTELVAASGDLGLAETDERTEDFPSIFIFRGCEAWTKSSRMRLMTSSLKTTNRRMIFRCLESETGLFVLNSISDWITNGGVRVPINR